MLHGAIAAAVTPLVGGSVIDEESIGPYVDFLAVHGLDGILALGTTGEGVLFDLDERREVAELFVDAARDRLQVAVHAGAQSTADTVALAEHAAVTGANAVAVIGPPYYALGEAELLAHFESAALACAPLPFYVYEFAARSGYAVPLNVLAELRDRAPNFVGMKVSDAPWEKLEPFIIEGLDVFVGYEGLVPRGLAAGAAGAVSGLAAAFPEEVAALVAEPTPEAGERAEALRLSLQRFPFQAALKTALGVRGVPVRAGVRGPLRGLHEDEAREVERIVREWTAAQSAGARSA